MPAERRRGAAGMDIDAITLDGLIIVGELKTTKPYQPGFGAQLGAQQRTMILKDLDRLQSTAADYRIMFVTDAEAFRTLCGKKFAARAPNVVDLITGRSSTSRR